ncbi:MAG: pentapeptide repeat-containing protein [Pseudomonadota bacterium]
MDAGSGSGQTQPGRQPLWYVRRHGREHGPHPRRVVVDGLLLGRFEASDLASLDRVQWQPLHAFAELSCAQDGPPAAAVVPAGEGRDPEDEWDGERRAAARRWADERSGRDRRTGRPVSPDGGERRALGDRRVSDEPLQVSLWRRVRLDRRALHSVARDGRVLAGVALAALAVTLVIALSAPAPVAIPLEAARGTGCDRAGGPGVDWRGCTKEAAQLPGVDLRRARLAGIRLRDAELSKARLDYADLSGADLTRVRMPQARLFGATLREVEMPAGDLRGADLSYADLRGAVIAGANFEGARLDHAWWVDGRRCASGSVGRCD